MIDDRPEILRDEFIFTLKFLLKHKLTNHKDISPWYDLITKSNSLTSDEFSISLTAAKHWTDRIERWLKMRSMNADIITYIDDLDLETLPSHLQYCTDRYLTVIPISRPELIASRTEELRQILEWISRYIAGELPRDPKVLGYIQRHWKTLENRRKDLDAKLSDSTDHIRALNGDAGVIALRTRLTRRLVYAQPETYYACLNIVTMLTSIAGQAAKSPPSRLELANSTA